MSERALRYVARLARRAAALVLAGLLVPWGANAQSLLRGLVRDSATGAPIAGAEVRVPALRVAARTDAAGRYTLDDIDGGRWVVLVRLVGFDSASAVLPFSGADTVARDFRLARTGQPLPNVPVTVADTPPMTAKMRSFESRRAEGIGHFITSVMLAKQENHRLADVIQQLPGTQIVRPPSRRGSGMRAYVGTSRGVSSLEGLPGTCLAAVWLDGTLVYNGPPADPFDINSLQVSEVSGVEYYAGGAQMPLQFRLTSKTCGAIVIWTK